MANELNSTLFYVYLTQVRNEVTKEQATIRKDLAVYIQLPSTTDNTLLKEWYLFPRYQAGISPDSVPDHSFFSLFT